MKQRSWIKWAAGLVVVALLAAGLTKVLSSRQTQQVTLKNSQPNVIKPLELNPSDVVKVQTLTLQEGVAISGSLKAVNSAVVKARVAGELQGLSVREGDTVAQGQVLGRIDPTEFQARLRQAQEQAQTAKSQVDIAQRQYDNNKALVDQGFISRTALESTSSSLMGAQASYRAALAAVDLAQKVLDDGVLRAPLSGVVSARLAQPGERLATDARVLEIVDMQQFELEAALSAADALQARVGQTAKLTIEGTPTTVTAKVVRINPSTLSGSRSVLTYLSVAPVPGLRQGLFAQGQLTTGQASGLALPLDAVRTDKPQTYVQTIDKGVVVHQAVTTGARGTVNGNGPTYTLLAGTAGLEEGSLVIRAEVGSLRAGTTVTLGQR